MNNVSLVVMALMMSGDEWYSAYLIIEFTKLLRKTKSGDAVFFRETNFPLTGVSFPAPKVLNTSSTCGRSAQDI